MIICPERGANVLEKRPSNGYGSITSCSERIVQVSKLKTSLIVSVRNHQCQHCFYYIFTTPIVLVFDTLHY